MALRVSPLPTLARKDVRALRDAGVSDVIAVDTSLGESTCCRKYIFGVQEQDTQFSYARLVPCASFPQSSYQFIQIAFPRKVRGEQSCFGNKKVALFVEGLEPKMLLRKRRERQDRFKLFFDGMEEGHDGNSRTEEKNLAVAIKQPAIGGVLPTGCPSPMM